jgi:hypothetical protein
MTNTHKAGYVQDVRYAGYAGRLYGCSRLITSGTSNPAITGDAKRRKWWGMVRFLSVSGRFAESNFLSLRPGSMGKAGG